MSRFKLGYLKPTKTVWHTLEGVHIPASNPNPARLELRPAGRCNADFTSALIKAQKQREAETGTTTAAGLDAADEKQARLFAKHVVCGWAEVNNELGEPMPFSAALAEELLLEIAIDQQRPDIVNAAYVIAFNLDNFAEGAAAAASLGKR